MRSRHHAFRFVAVAVLATLLAACTAASTPAPTRAPTPAPTAAASPTAPAGALPKPELSSIRIGLAAAGEISSVATIQAAQLKIFDKYGITTSVSSFEGSAKGAAALQAGQIDIGGVDAGSALSSHLSDVPLVALTLAATFLTDNLVCGPAIKGAADVKGKRIAVGSFGGPSHAAALLSLKALKLGATDAAITQVGGQANRIAAVKGGSTECGIVDKNLEADMVRDGLNIVASIWKPPTQPFGRSAVLVTKDWLQKNPNTAMVVVAAVLEGQNLVWTDPTGTAQRFAQHLQTTPDKTQPLVADFQTIGNRSLMWTQEAFLNAQKVLATVNPDIIDVTVTDAFDRTILEKLLQNGFYAKIGNPVTTP